MVSLFLLALTPAALEIADIAPQTLRVPSLDASGIPVNAALITNEGFSDAALVLTDDAGVQSETSLTRVDVLGLGVFTLPEQPPQTAVQVRLGFAGSFVDEARWTTGVQRLDDVTEAPEVERAGVAGPPFESRRVNVTIAADATRAAAVMFRVDGDERTHVSTQLLPFGGSAFFTDFDPPLGEQDYEVFSVDQVGNVSEPTAFSVVDGWGCSALSPSTCAAFALLALLLLRRRRAVR